MKIINYIVEKSKNGILVGLSDTKGVFSQAKTLEELKKNLLNAARLNGHHRFSLRRKFKMQRKKTPSAHISPESQSLDVFFERVSQLDDTNGFLSDVERRCLEQDSDPFEQLIPLKSK